MSATLRFALLGWPVAHSLSPALHRAAHGVLGLEADYRLEPVAPAALARAVAALRAGDTAGFNVTLPHKEAILPLLDAVEPEAGAIGAVNTVWRRDGALVGANTDAEGLVRALREARLRPEGARAVVLGAGGAARAAAFGLAGAGAGSLTVAARRPERARAVTRALGADHPATPVALGEPAAVAAAFADADLVVQATSATLEGAGGAGTAEAFAAALPWGALGPGAAVVELVYRPLETAVLRRARARGLRCVDGLGMLVHQAILALARWGLDDGSRREALAEAMRAAARSAAGR